jgi:hypothetical protein
MRPDLSMPTLGGIKRWFTAEPDPESVVIDLRETITVGPFIVLLDRIVGFAAGAYRDSWLDSLVGRFRRGFLGKSWVRLRESRVGRGIATILAPPEPPTGSRGDDSGASPGAGSSRDQ